MATELPNSIDFDQLPDSAWVRQPIVSQLCGGADRTTLYRWAKTGIFPAPRKLAPQTTAWNVGELRRHFAAVAERAA